MNGPQRGLAVKIFSKKKENKKMKRVLSLILAIIAITSMTAFANEEVMLISENPTEEVAVMPEAMYTSAYGTITEVADDYVMVKTMDNEEIQFNTSEFTQVIDANTVMPLDLKSRETDLVMITYANAMTMSLPPQAYAFAIVGNIKSEMGNPMFTIVEEVKTAEDGIVIVTDGGMKEITVPANAQVSPYLTRNIVTLADIKEGSNVLLWYDMMTMSIPAFATSERVVVMAGNVMDVFNEEETEEVTEDGLYVNDVKITLAEDEVEYDNNGVKMLPLRTVAETLGFKVEWVNESQSIIVSNGAFSATIRIGTVEGGINKMRLVLETAPILYNDCKTYVPASFFNELPAIN